MRFFLLLLTTGLANCLQPGHKYVYHYRARVTEGIPELNKNHAAVVDFRADLQVSGIPSIGVLFKLNDVEFGTSNGNFSCGSLEDLGTPLPVEYTSSSLGEHEFLLSEQGELLFHEDEKLWTINFYKSIVLLFGISIPPTEDEQTLSESSYEETGETVIGSCRSTYTNHRLFGIEASLHEEFAQHHIESDCQRDSGATSARQTSKTSSGRKFPGRKFTGRKTHSSKTSQSSSCDNIDDPIYKVTRSINMDDCSDIKLFKHNLGGHVDCQGKEFQCQNFHSRDSYGEFYIRGRPSAMRIEKAEVTGTTIVSPFGYKTEHLTSVSKQKLALVSVEPLTHEPDVNILTQAIRDFKPQLTLPSSNMQIQQNFFNALGIETDAEMRQRQKEHVKEIFKSLPFLLNPMEDSGIVEAPNFLNYARNHMRYLNKEDLEEVKEDALSNTQYKGIFYDVLATLGTKDSTDMILADLAKLPPIRQVVILGSLGNNLLDSRSLKDLLAFVKNVDLEEAPFTASHFLVNFATLVRRVCSLFSMKSYAIQDHSSCYTDSIVTGLREHITTQLNSANKFWMQMVLVKALVNMQDIEATNAILPYVLGKKDVDPMVRAIAMDALASWNAVTPNQRNKFVQILLDIFENPGEKREVRARALGYLSSWHLTPTEWTRLAMFTRRPGNKDLAALTYSLIKTTSEYKSPDTLEQSQFASHALVHARPVSRAKRHSSFHTWIQYCFSNYIGNIDHLSIIKDPASPLPAELAAYTRSAFAGLVFHNKLEAMIANDDGDLAEIAVAVVLGWPTPQRKPSITGNWGSYFQSLRNGLNIENKVRERINGAINLMTSSGIELFLPLETEIIFDAYRVFNIRSDKHTTPIFVNSVDYFHLSVNDIGLPSLIMISVPKVFFSSGFLTDAMTGPHTGYVRTTGGIVYSRQYASANEILIPTEKHYINSVLVNTLTLRLPFKFRVTVTVEEEEDGRPKGVQVSIAGRGDELGTLVGARNMPLTSSGGIELPKIEDVMQQIKFVAIAGETPTSNTETELALGLHLKTSGYELPKISDWEEIMKYFDKHLLSPSAKFHTEHLFMDPLESDVFKVTINASLTHKKRTSDEFVSKYGQDSFKEYELCGNSGAAAFTQQSTGGDYYDSVGGQVQQSPGQFDFDTAGQNQGEMEFETFGTFGAQQQVDKPSRLQDGDVETHNHVNGFGDTKEPQLQHFIDHLRTFPEWQNAIDGFALRVQYEEAMGYENSPRVVKKLAGEGLMVRTSCYGLPDQVETRAVIGFTIANMPSLSYCLDTKMIHPKINDMDTLEGILSKNLTKVKITKGYAGTNCNTYVGTTKEKLWLSKDRLEELAKKAKSDESCSDVDPMSAFLQSTYYDHHELDATWKNFAKLEPYPLVTANMQLYNRFMKDFYGLEVPLDHGYTPTQEYISYYRNVSRNKDGEYNVRQKLGTGQIKYSEIELSSDWLKYGLGVTFESDYTEGDYCVISDHSVHTFDGLNVNATVDDCPVLVSTSCDEFERYPFVVGVNKNRQGELTVHIAVGLTKMAITIDPQEVKVNNEYVDTGRYVQEFHYDHPWKRPEDRVGAIVYKRHGYYKVHVEDTLDVIHKKDKIYLKVADRYRGYLCGLCGNSDLEPSNDLVTPENCALVHPEDFAKSWTPASGFSCSVGYQASEDCNKAGTWDNQYYSNHKIPHSYSVSVGEVGYGAAP